jgi:hypothetical protein
MLIYYINIKIFKNSVVLITFKNVTTILFIYYIISYIINNKIKNHVKLIIINYFNKFLHIN